MPHVGVRVCSLSITSGVGEFDPTGLYVVVKIGRDAQRTRVLGGRERGMAWDEVFDFVLPATSAASASSHGVSAQMAGGGNNIVNPSVLYHSTSNRDFGHYNPGMGDPTGVYAHGMGSNGHPMAYNSGGVWNGSVGGFSEMPGQYTPGVFSTSIGSSNVDQPMGSRSVLMQSAKRGGPPPILFELWRWSESADDCLGVYTLFGDDALGTADGEIIDRKIVFNKSSSYSVSTSLRVRMSASDFGASRAHLTDPSETGASLAWGSLASSRGTYISEFNDDDMSSNFHRQIAGGNGFTSYPGTAGAQAHGASFMGARPTLYNDVNPLALGAQNQVYTTGISAVMSDSSDIYGEYAGQQHAEVPPMKMLPRQAIQRSHPAPRFQGGFQGEHQVFQSSPAFISPSSLQPNTPIEGMRNSSSAHGATLRGGSRETAAPHQSVLGNPHAGGGEMRPSSSLLSSYQQNTQVHRQMGDFTDSRSRQSIGTEHNAYNNNYGSTGDVPRQSKLPIGVSANAPYSTGNVSTSQSLLSTPYLLPPHSHASSSPRHAEAGFGVCGGAKAPALLTRTSMGTSILAHPQMQRTDATASSSDGGGGGSVSLYDNLYDQ